MPLIEMTLPDRSEFRARMPHMARDLTNLFVRMQGAKPENETARGITRLEVNYKTEGELYVGGMPAEQPLVRLVFWSPEGALSGGEKEQMVREATFITSGWLGLTPGPDGHHDVWCMIHEVASDGWASAGRVYDWRKIKRYVAKGEIARRREAMAMEQERKHA